ncbi:hypothetical protein D6D19_06929 [Aureobasidium pullulans]|uniref:Uncharacterized protein n=1 Tax=Aureobasidium pullulans TaxID=5580 RepID=A0A4S8ZZS4_AURPU|nr:hypothetical protein D6D19_06929 [Aureobasidium pullulans]
MIPRTLLPLLVCLFAHVLSVSSSPLVVERAAATCAAKDIATVKRTVADPVYFCQWWQQDVRTRSPFMEFSATQVDTLCKCISPVATGPKCKRKRKRSQIEERSALVARSAASCSAEVSAQFTQPYRFCTFYTAYTKKTSTSTKKTTTSTKKAVVTTAQKPVTTTSRKPVTSTTKKPTTSTAKKPVTSTIKKPTSTSTQKPISTSTKKPTSTSTKKPTSTSTTKPASTSTKKATIRKDDINEREASHIGKLKEAHDNHDEASNNQSQGFNFKHQESFNNQLKEMSTSLLLLYCHSAEITIMVQVIAPAWKHSNSVHEPAKLKASFPDPTARRRPYQ